MHAPQRSLQPGPQQPGRAGAETSAGGGTAKEEAEYAYICGRKKNEVALCVAAWMDTEIHCHAVNK